MKRFIGLAMLGVGLFLLSFTGEQKGYKVGDVIADFSLKSIKGETVSLQSYKEAKGFIIVFTCNHCPFSVAYEDRIIALHKKYNPKGFPVVAINSNNAELVPEDSFEGMIQRATEKKFTFNYLHDESQAVARLFGAARTPHVFIVEKKNGELVLKYIGAIDDNTDQPEAVTKKYVETALNEIISGKEVSNPMTKAIGCTIKWKKP